jgi:hypothetical protein
MSHYLSRFAAFVIETGAKISTAGGLLHYLVNFFSNDFSSNLFVFCFLLSESRKQKTKEKERPYKILSLDLENLGTDCGRPDLRTK